MCAVGSPEGKRPPPAVAAAGSDGEGEVIPRPQRGPWHRDPDESCERCRTYVEAMDQRAAMVETFSLGTARRHVHCEPPGGQQQTGGASQPASEGGLRHGDLQPAGAPAAPAQAPAQDEAKQPLEAEHALLLKKRHELLQKLSDSGVRQQPGGRSGVGKRPDACRRTTRELHFWPRHAQRGNDLARHVRLVQRQSR